MTPINPFKFINMSNAFANPAINSTIAAANVMGEIGGFVNSAINFGAMDRNIPVNMQSTAFNFSGMTMPNIDFTSFQMPMNLNFSIPSFNLSNFNFGAFNFNFGYQSKPINFALTSNKSRNAVNLATSQLGVRENSGSNDGYQIDKFRKGQSNGQPWCASFVSWCYSDGQNNNNNKTFGHDASVLSIKSKAQKNGYYSNKSQYGGRPGDLAIWSNNHHIGIVKSVSADGTQVTVVEGNHNDSVVEKTYNISDPKLGGFVRMNEWLEA